MNRDAWEATEPVGPGLEFERIILMVNPNSTRSKSIKADIDELESSRYGNRIIKFVTSANHRVNQEVLRQNARVDDLLISAGGDGTANQAATMAMELGTKLLILQGGNAGDISYSVHGSTPLPPPSHILDYGHSLPTHPIEVHTDTETEHTDGIAVGYAGFGFTALAAQVLNNSAYRKFTTNSFIRTASESAVALGVVTAALPFRIEHDGQIEELTELMAANGGRVAKRLALPVNIEEDRIFIARLEKDLHWQKLISWGVSVARRRQPNIKGIFLQSETFSFIARDRICWQCDGEPQALEPDTQVSIKQSDGSLYLVTYQRKHVYSPLKLLLPEPKMPK